MTHIAGIRMKNFARFRGEHELAPLGPKPYAIVARQEGDDSRSNWLGKSTLRIAVRYALYGVLPRQYETIDSVVSRGEDEMHVDVELSDGTYVSRERKRGKHTRLRLVVPLADGAEIELHQDAAQSKLEELLGLDRKNYDICADIEQKQADRFSTLTSEPLTDVVNGWVGIDKLIAAEDEAAKGLGQLVRELGYTEAEFTRFEWATADEGVRRKITQQAAVSAFERQSKEAAEHNDRVAKHDQWVKHEENDVRSCNLQNERRALVLEMDRAEDPCDEVLETARLKGVTAEAEARVASTEECRLKTVVLGKFDGACPVLPGFECPSKSVINARRGASKTALEEQTAVCVVKTAEAHRTYDEHRALLDRRRAQDGRRVRLEAMDRENKTLAESVAYMERNGEPPPVAPSMQAVDSEPVSRAKREHQEWVDARAKLLDVTNELARRRPRVAAYRVAVDALEQAQRRLCEGAVQSIERGANRRLHRAGIDLRVEFRWGRETNRLATRCGKCGAEFPASARVKSCPACQTVRGLRVEPKLHLWFSSRSGAAEDVSGVAITLSAGQWIRSRRGSQYGTVWLDEPFASLDLSHRRALAAHLTQLVSDGTEQAFVIAHDRAVLESLPGRIEVVGDGEWSTVRLVA